MTKETDYFGRLAVQAGLAVALVMGLVAVPVRTDRKLVDCYLWKESASSDPYHSPRFLGPGQVLLRFVDRLELGSGGARHRRRSSTLEIDIHRKCS